LEILGNSDVFVHIHATIKNTDDLDTCCLSTNLYIKDSTKHEFNSIHNNSQGEYVDGHFKFLSNTSNSEFIKPGVIYRFVVTYTLTYKILFFKMHQSLSETRNFTLSEATINSMKNDTSDENDYNSGVQVRLFP